MSADRHGPSFRKGQYVACKFHGSGNGDLIVGRIRSVRTNGDVTLDNLITGARSTKTVTVLASRNVVVRKRDAVRIAELGKVDRQAARAAAVELARGPRPDPEVDRLVRELRALDERRFDAVTRAVWREVLVHLGVQ